MHLLVCHYVEFKMMNPMFYCFLHYEKLNKLCDKRLPSHTRCFTLLCAAPVWLFSVWNWTPGLEAGFRSPCGWDVRRRKGTCMKSPLPMAELQAGTLEPGSFPVPSEEQHHPVSGMWVLTVPYHLWLSCCVHRGVGHLSQLSCAMSDWPDVIQCRELGSDEQKEE